jgi:hypothetical protein
MPQYEVKSGRTIFFVNAVDKIDAIYRFKKSCDIDHIDAVTYVHGSNVLDNIIDQLEEERSLYFDYWQPPRRKNGIY